MLWRPAQSITLSRPLPYRIPCHFAFYLFLVLLWKYLAAFLGYAQALPGTTHYSRFSCLFSSGFFCLFCVYNHQLAPLSNRSFLFLVVANGYLWILREFNKGYKGLQWIYSPLNRKSGLWGKQIISESEYLLLMLVLSKCRVR